MSTYLDTENGVWEIHFSELRRINHALLFIYAYCRLWKRLLARSLLNNQAFKQEKARHLLGFRNSFFKNIQRKDCYWQLECAGCAFR